MIRVNRDTVIAIMLVAFSGAAFRTTFDIQTRDDGIMQATVWPRMILAFMAVFSLIYLFRSLRASSNDDGHDGASVVVGALKYYRNPIICFVLYFLFLATLPYLGMLIGGMLLVFLLLSVLGGIERPKLLLHLSIAVFSIGGMWTIFTFALKVILPAGEILPLIYKM